MDNQQRSPKGNVQRPVERRRAKWLEMGRLVQVKLTSKIWSSLYRNIKQLNRIEMNYKKLYFAFIEKYKSQEISVGEYTEIHHILPRYAGGDDSEENLVRLTYRQHVFVHHLWAKATNDLEAIVAYRLMSGISTDKRKETAVLGGLKSKQTGWLDKIRHLANTPERQRKLKILHEDMRQDGRLEKHIRLANDAWRGCNHTQEYKDNKSIHLRDKFIEDADYREKVLNTQKLGIQKRFENSQELSEEVINNAERNEIFLTKISNKSLNKFVSPEGLEFDSPIYAAKYYGNVKPHVIENWCKRSQNGWSRKPKAV